MDLTAERTGQGSVSKLEDRAIEIIQGEAQREKKNLKNRALGISQIISNSATYKLDERQKCAETRG